MWGIMAALGLGVMAKEKYDKRGIGTDAWLQRTEPSAYQRALRKKTIYKNLPLTSVEQTAWDKSADGRMEREEAERRKQLGL